MRRPCRPIATPAALVVAALLATACAPPMDWREFVPEGSGLHVSFPCRPDSSSRRVALAGTGVTMHLLACTAAQTTFAVGYADLDDPARIAAALAELRHAAAANIEASAPRIVALQVAGMTPNAESARLVIDGHRPDGTPLQAHAAFFAHGLRVYQATVIGEHPVPRDVDTFIAALRFPSA